MGLINGNLDKEKFMRLDEVYREAREIFPDGDSNFPAKFLHIVIAGGAVRDIFFDLDTRDYDIYVIPEFSSDEPKQLAKSLNFARKALRDFYSIDQYENAVKKSSFKLIDPTSKGLRTLNLEDENLIFKFMDVVKGDSKPMQYLFHTQVHNPQELVDSFDLDICQFGYDGSDWILGSDMDLKNVKRALFDGGPVELQNPYSTFSRLRKFQNRYGCEVTRAAKRFLEILKEEKEDHLLPKFIGESAKESEEVDWSYVGSSLDLYMMKNKPDDLWEDLGIKSEIDEFFDELSEQNEDSNRSNDANPDTSDVLRSITY